MDTSASSSRFAAAAAALLLLPALSAADDWADAHATFYGDETGGETMRKKAAMTVHGACGYGNLFEQGYGLDTTALSVALFNQGWSCGGCYAVRAASAYCAPVAVTATNLCPANHSKPSGNWCNPPLRHFDLSNPAFLRLVTDFRAGIVPVQYRRVPCARRGGVRVEMKGNRWWVGVLVFNVAGAGDLRAVAVRGSRDGAWADMARSWGQIWTSGDGRSGWAFGQSFEGRGQF
ncbi:LOW QUALITY PROTEIN: hypothetical protein GQ55_6G014600 [Panicum hallii var. hallii]|uniref:Expansin n=1 Tax=Panicum hallii var. hallii TaxID=1504633 RepID=A0A2T7D2T7_9POAL|nr:LOW QUALITY PROTEIN: hypothetical protein GQ55_6G014600 [Panicum hallii var. hallii]